VKPVVVTVLAALVLAGGCASREELVAKSAATPAGVDLSGLWSLRPDDSDTMRRITEAGRDAAGGRQAIVPTRQAKKQAASTRMADGASVHVFLETGSELKVTQTAFALFISFDRAVVEEYRFGEKRQISVGPIVADRVSGWEGDGYVIETLDEDGAKLIETYRLNTNDDSLVRTILIVRKDKGHLDIEQVFDRS
jgi:hypothetical protein